MAADRIAPQFKLKDALNQEVSLSQFRGQLTLVHFWASWCPPCLAELPKVLELARQFQGRPFKIVLISLDENWKDAAKALPAGPLPSNIVSLIDPTSKVAEEYGSYQFPESYLLDPSQKIVTKWVGGQAWDSEPIHKLLERLMGAVSG